MGGICLNGLVAGSLLRPPPMKKVYKVKFCVLKHILPSFQLTLPLRLKWFRLPDMHNVEI